MLISTKGRYALRVMLELAQGEPGECMPLPVIAQRQGISEKYLESIIAVLARAGLVEGQRGKGGGYRLSRELKDYSVGEIVRLTEGSLAPVSGLEGENTCPRADKCLSLPVWEKLDTLINDYLDSVSLADLLAEGGGNGCGGDSIVFCLECRGIDQLHCAGISASLYRSSNIDQRNAGAGLPAADQYPALG